ncbi:hypothetical protein [Nocardia cyriacigeorgica]|uniref:hypothetical protein n=1 Tax=Nocardia cyriacigeorgica TaxID=135487 RepID=UPI0018962642|nr:hypothetical protein [Nocardia cyriacigeorgica]MBF6285400.1 hypothetical protein [Nocardia cyriacigeorgica]
MERKQGDMATIRDAAQGSELDLLCALRDKIAGDLDDGVPPHAVARLVGELRSIDERIRELGNLDQGSVIAETPDEAWDGTGY